MPLVAAAVGSPHPATAPHRDRARAAPPSREPRWRAVRSLYRAQQRRRIHADYRLSGSHQRPPAELSGKRRSVSMYVRVELRTSPQLVAERFDQAQGRSNRRAGSTERERTDPPQAFVRDEHGLAQARSLRAQERDVGARVGADQLRRTLAPGVVETRAVGLAECALRCHDQVFRRRPCRWSPQRPPHLGHCAGAGRLHRVRKPSFHAVSVILIASVMEHAALKRAATSLAAAGWLRPFGLGSPHLPTNGQEPLDVGSPDPKLLRRMAFNPQLGSSACRAGASIFERGRAGRRRLRQLRCAINNSSNAWRSRKAPRCWCGYKGSKPELADGWAARGGSSALAGGRRAGTRCRGRRACTTAGRARSGGPAHPYRSLTAAIVPYSQACPYWTASCRPVFEFTSSFPDGSSALTARERDVL